MTPTPGWFRLVVRKGVDVCGGPSAGTEYTLDGACPVCGTGAVQVGALKLPRFKALAAPIFSTLDDEILVSAALGETLRERGVSCLGPVLLQDTGEPLPFWQLVPQGELPPFSNRQTGFVRERPCPKCGRDGYFTDPGVTAPLLYESLPPSLRDRDLLATFERFGNSRLRTPFRDSVFAAPLPVAGARLADALRSGSVRGLELEPVQVGAASEQAGTATGRPR